MKTPTLFVEPRRFASDLLKIIWRRGGNGRITTYSTEMSSAPNDFNLEYQ